MDQVIVALDNFDKDEIVNFLDEYGDDIKTIKLGLELFNRYGKEFIQKIQTRYNKDIFLDLKLHDIPVTVAKAIKSLSGLNPKFLTIHLTGGSQMIQYAIKARDQYLSNTKILGVSILTSLDEEDCKNIYHNNLISAFTSLVELGAKNGIDGIVLSPHELSMAIEIEDKLSQKLLKVTPGIRLTGDANDDQKRIMTPTEALKNGSDFMVIGRSITKNPQVLKKSNLFTLK